MAMHTLTDHLSDDNATFTFEWDTQRDAAAQWIKARRSDAWLREGNDSEEDFNAGLEWRDSLVNQMRKGRLEPSDVALWEFSLRSA